MKRFSLMICGAWLALAACGKDDPNPGTEGGACLAGDVCAEPLTCASNVCVDLTEGGSGTFADDGALDDAGDGVGDDGVGDDGVGDDGPVEDDGADGDDGVDDGNPGGDDGAEVYCSSDDELCLCGHTADYGPPGGPCSSATVTAPNLCCASEGWPAYGGCSCWHVSCRRISNDTCLCAIGGVDPEDEAVSSCTASEGVCCSDGNTCSCHEGLSQCVFEDEVEVSSCSVSSLSCNAGDSSTEACA